MARYINADVVEERLNEHLKITMNMGHSAFEINDDDIEYIKVLHLANKFLKRLPTANVRENVKGEWENILHPGLYFSKNVQCSRCFNIGPYEGFNFCPNCGADMRGEEQ